MWRVNVSVGFVLLGVKQPLPPYGGDRLRGDRAPPLAYGQPRFRPDYNTPEGFRAGEETKDKMDDEWKELRWIDKGMMENPNKAYTEGGLVFLPRKGMPTKRRRYGATGTTVSGVPK